MMEYKVITNEEWHKLNPDEARKRAAKPAPKPRRGTKKTVLLRDENGTKYYGRLD